MIQSKKTKAKPHITTQAAAEAVAEAVAEVDASAAVIAAEVAVSESTAVLKQTLGEILQTVKKAAAETMQITKSVAAAKLLRARQDANKKRQLATEITHSMNQELLKWQQALNSIPQGVLIADAKRRITYVNDAFEQMTGYTSAAVLGGSCAVLQGVDTNQETVSQLRAALNAGEPFHAEILNYHKNGTPFWNDLSITLVRDRAGKIMQFVGLQHDITDHKVEHERIEHLAFFDVLTDLPNRRLLMDRLNHAFMASQRSGREGAVLFIDADNFKLVNDTLGHHMGDLLIQQISKRLLSCLRVGDTVARLGGDEFVVVLEALSDQRIEAMNQVSIVSNKILTILSQPYKLDENEYYGTCSVGAALFSDHHLSAEEVLKRADIALFRSKNSGRNKLTFFSNETQNVGYNRKPIEREVRTALRS